MFGLSMFLVSCDEDEDSKSCTCTEEGYSGSRTIDPASYSAKNCSDLELKLAEASVQAGYGRSYFHCN